MKGLYILYFAIVLVVCNATKNSFNYVVHERHNAMPNTRLKRSITDFRKSEDPKITMRIGIKHQNLHLAEQHVTDVSHPESPSYGKHWTMEQVIKSFAPSEETISTVKSWLLAEGIADSDISISKDMSWIKVKTSINEVSTLLKTEYHAFEDSSTETVYIACDEYHVPDFIHPLIDFITPTVQPAKGSFNTVKRSLATKYNRISPSHNTIAARGIPENLSTCNQNVTIDCIRALYNIPQAVSANPNNSLGVIELNQGGWYSQIDLDLFFGKYSEPLVGHPPQAILIDGAVAAYTQPFAPDRDLAEPDLDLELTMSLTYPLNVTLYSVGDEYIGASMDTWLDALDASYCTFMGGDVPGIDPIYPDNETAYPGYGTPYNKTEECGGARPSHVYSLSLAAVEWAFSNNYLTRMCEEFMKLSLQGSTFLYASDDYGVGGPSELGCIGPNSTTFTPAWPATCPWVTAVGGTVINENSTVLDPESAWSLSGGGFSDVFPLPSWQSEAVLNWFNNNPTNYPPGTFNNSRQTRGVPDLAANSLNIVVATSGNFTMLSGTSASTPIVASIITLINNARLDAGKGPVGFINPVIYANPQAFNDITTGHNIGCGTNGFNATKGWDPVTGLGTPDYEKLLKVFMDLP